MPELNAIVPPPPSFEDTGCIISLVGEKLKQVTDDIVPKVQNETFDPDAVKVSPEPGSIKSDIEVIERPSSRFRVDPVEEPKVTTNVHEMSSTTVQTIVEHLPHEIKEKTIETTEQIVTKVTNIVEQLPSALSTPGKPLI